ncbi:MAG: hypothetical protein ACKPKO_01785, partial [Candidatus Fonsibacter sp.]
FPVDVILCPLMVPHGAVMFPLYDSTFPYVDIFPIDDVMFPVVDVMFPVAVIDEPALKVVPALIELRDVIVAPCILLSEVIFPLLAFDIRYRPRQCRPLYP